MPTKELARHATDSGRGSDAVGHDIYNALALGRRKLSDGRIEQPDDALPFPHGRLSHPRGSHEVEAILRDTRAPCCCDGFEKEYVIHGACSTPGATKSIFKGVAVGKYLPTATPLKIDLT
jgi:hypothetical protein